ncbi:MAG: hybrid sensor histidine kinase/response regulator, partial [Leptothrix sp. (in: b-proteobacteria)]
MPTDPLRSAAPVAPDDDLSALAWVHEALRKTLEAAHKGLRRYLREAEAAAQSDLDDVDPTILRNARQNLHEGVGALQLVGLPEGVALLRASEAAVQRFVARPQRLDPKGVEAIERASFALLDYLSRRLAGKPAPALALFPQLRVLLEQNGAERIHPADLWSHDWRWRQVSLPAGTAHHADASVLADVERRLLALVKQNRPDAAAGLVRAFHAVALDAPQAPTAPGAEATLWAITAACFEAWGCGLIEPDLFLKRTASRALAALRARVKGDREVSARLAQDLLFFCARAHAADPARTPLLQAVRRAYALADDPLSRGEVADGADVCGVSYDEPRYGRHDPAQITQARKRIAAAKEAWNGASAIERQRVASLIEAFTLVGDSIRKLCPGGGHLADALLAVASESARATRPPEAELAMEVATSLLYLDAALDEGEFDQPGLAARAELMALRIEHVASGAPAEPLEVWMEELYRRASDRQTMGSVVQELRSSLAEAERQIDQFFRSPAEAGLLAPVPGLLGGMRGVFAVLSIAPAVQAVLRMRDDVELLLHGDADPHGADTLAGFHRLAGNLGALGFLIDMLGVQPQMAQALFRFDASTGVLAPLMGRHSAGAELADRALAIADAARRGEVPLDQVSAEIVALSQAHGVHGQP